jgi:hypothetical protein
MRRHLNNTANLFTDNIGLLNTIGHQLAGLGEDWSACGRPAEIRQQFGPFPPKTVRISSIRYSPLTPSSEPTMALVQMINPTDYPTKVLSM